ncbi:MAG TPA: hypothetical protein GX507_05025 [Clostridia bacterium]|nr:hypothetical protein [Clostridia bacterium]
MKPAGKLSNRARPSSKRLRRPRRRGFRGFNVSKGAADARRDAAGRIGAVAERRSRTWASRVAVLGILGVFLWCGGMLARRVILPAFVRTALAETGRVEETLECKALVVWEGVTITSPASGKVELLAKEGEKVRVDQPLFTVINPDLEKELKARLREKTEEREKFSSRYVPRIHELEAAFQDAKADVAAAVDGLRQALRGQDEEAVRRARKALDQAFKEHDEIEAEMKRLDSEMRRLSEEEKRVKDMLSSSRHVITSPTTGTVTFQVDEPGSRVVADDLENIRPDVVFRSDNRRRSVKMGDVVRAGDAVCEVFDDSKAYLVFAIKEGTCRDLVNKSRMGLIVRGEDPDDAIEVIPRFTGGTSGDGYVAFVAETGEGTRLLHEDKVIDATLITDVHEGVVVPITALCERKGEQGVFVMKKTTARFLPVTVKGKDSRRAVVEGIEPGSEVVLTPRLVEDGQELYR